MSGRATRASSHFFRNAARQWRAPTMAPVIEAIVSVSSPEAAATPIAVTGSCAQHIVIA